LEDYRNEYISLRGKDRHQFWHKFFNAWWQKYPWRLPDDEEPPVEDNAKMQELSHVGTDGDAKAETEVKAREVSVT
jgi:hypothetical protein